MLRVKIKAIKENLLRLSSDGYADGGLHIIVF